VQIVAEIYFYLPDLFLNLTPFLFALSCDYIGYIPLHLRRLLPAYNMILFPVLATSPIVKVENLLVLS
jgi:hypothetical protein